MNNQMQKPTAAFVMAAWAALFLGSFAFVIGLWNAEMQLSEKGYFATVILYGLFSAVSLQKTVRDKLDGIPVTGIYYNLCWASLAISIFLLGVGLWFATLLLSEKGFYAMAFLLSLFGAISVQKNIRDIALLNDTANKSV
ncbi:MAG: inner membrane protein YiaA [Sideroxydans sp.]|nr:inner membrane protein YiaA [Sideroxydans sp.]